MNEHEELEWAVRQYSMAVDYLLSVFEKHENVPPRVGAALDQLTTAVIEEWEEGELTLG